MFFNKKKNKINSEIHLHQKKVIPNKKHHLQKKY